MSSLHVDRPPVQDAPFAPDPDDALWAAQAFADAYPDECPELPEAAYYDPAEDLDEQAAIEAAYFDALDRGLIPTDLAGWIARTSPVGHD